MTYYKAFDRNMKCRGFQYAEGETFEIEGELGLCSNGLHFCKDLVMTLEYYPVKESITENLYAEVEPLGDVIWDEPNRHKGCTNRLKIIRVLLDGEVMAMVDTANNSGELNSGNSNSGDGNSGNWNSGDWNSDDRNSGDSNSGYRNSGDRNSGNWNSGDRNSGDSNSGYRNSGDRNSGNWNSGNWNSGDRNSGDWNSGNWNSGNHHSGAFCTGKPETILVFNKPCALDEWRDAYKPDFLYINPGNDYKAAFMKSWEEADPVDRERVRELPNFDADIFFEISGIDLR